MSVRRMSDHAGRLIYDRIVLIFEYNAYVIRRSQLTGVILVLEKQSVTGLNTVLNPCMDAVKFNGSVEFYALDPGGAHIEFAPHDLLDFASVIFTLNKIIYFHCYILTNY